MFQKPERALVVGRRRGSGSRLVTAPVFERIFPLGGKILSTASLFYFDAGRYGDAGYGKAHHLSLTATETANGVAH